MTSSKRHSEKLPNASPRCNQPVSAAKLQKNFSIDRTWEQTNPRTPILSVSKKEKVKTQEENNTATLRLMKRREQEEERLQAWDLQAVVRTIMQQFPCNS